MPCFGNRKKSKRKQQVAVSEKAGASAAATQQAQEPYQQQQQQQTTTYASQVNDHLNPPNTAAPTAAAGIDGRAGRPGSIASSHSTSAAQIRQEYNELKSKQSEHLDVIARQSAELQELRQLLESTKKQASSNDDDQQNLHEKLKQREKEIQELLQRIEQDDHEKRLAEKDELIRDKDKQLQELLRNDAESVKPALEQVTEQLEELKKANEQAVERLAEKEKELAVLRSQLNRRDRKPKDEAQRTADQKRLNRLTMDLENDRLMIQKLEELNKQLEVQKQKHEAILQTHAKEMAEKDRVLVQHQQSLNELKQSQEKAMKALERKQAQTIQELQLKHERDLKQLRERLENAEKRAKSDMNDEVEKLLREFEQSEHEHTVQLAHLQKSHQEQRSAMKQGQQKELQNHIKRQSMILGQASAPAAVPETTTPPVRTLRKTGGPASNKVIRWPVENMAALELIPKDPALVQLYITSVSANPSIKRNQEIAQTTLTTRQVQFQTVDVAQSEPALQHMRKQQQNMGGQKKNLPQIFVGGEYRGQLEDLQKAIEDDQLDMFLRPRGSHSAQQLSLSKRRSQVSTCSLSSNEPVTPSTSTIVNSSYAVPPTPIPRPNNEQSSKILPEDAELLKEIERELATSNVDFNF